MNIMFSGIIQFFFVTFNIFSADLLNTKIPINALKYYPTVPIKPLFDQQYGRFRRFFRL